MLGNLPVIDQLLCTLCGECVLACPQDAVSLPRHKLELDEARCNYCGACEEACPTGAVTLPLWIHLSENITREGSHA